MTTGTAQNRQNFRACGALCLRRRLRRASRTPSRTRMLSAVSTPCRPIGAVGVARALPLDFLFCALVWSRRRLLCVGGGHLNPLQLLGRGSQPPHEVETSARGGVLTPPALGAISWGGRRPRPPHDAVSMDISLGACSTAHCAHGAAPALAVARRFRFIFS